MAWSVERKAGSSRVLAAFEGHLSGPEGVASAKRFRDALGSEELDVVWDVTRMSGFDGAARSAWAETLWPVRGQIRSLRIVGAKGIVRVGATFLALLMGKPCEFVDSSEEARSAP